MFKRYPYAVVLLLLCFLSPVFSQEAGGDRSALVLNRRGATVALEPYAPNIIRVTVSTSKPEAIAPAGYGFIGAPAFSGWTHAQNAGGDTYSSSRLAVAVQAVPTRADPNALRSEADIANYFVGSVPGVHITIRTPEGKTLLDMLNWRMSVPNYKDGNALLLQQKRSTDKPFYTVGATFASPDDEHYYGLGQNQEGFLDYRGHRIECWHNYVATGGPSVCVPFLVSNYGYGMIWDNPSKTVIEPGFNGHVTWTSDVGNRVSFFVIAGANTDEIYSGYRVLTGPATMLPKAAYGFIQCKQRYASQDEVMAVAKGYRERHAPADMIVVDWFYFSKMGQMDMVPAQWPDPTGMNQKLHEMGFQSMISVWPRFLPGTRYYPLLLKNGWFEHLADGTPTNGLPYDKAGSDIDTTNPAAAKWYWNVIKENFIDKGFDSIWADETEPDLPPDASYFSAGPGARYYNIYPLVHTGAIYDGFRRDEKQRALILSRDAYLGIQRNGAMVWSSDIYPTWDTLKRQIPTGLDAAASGIVYWTQDIGGWQYLPSVHRPAHPPLIDPSDCRENVGGYDDYPELYTRWFEYGAFLPNFRTHGSRRYNEVWSYGKQAEPILIKYLKLRYQLMPYIYSLGYRSYVTGAPFMRALFMDFPDDQNVTDVRDEYMFGPAFLVAPMTEQGATSRKVYLPAGTDWYNYWTNQLVRGGQTIEVSAPIETIPLFVRAGSVIPIGSEVDSTAQKQDVVKVLVYPGRDADFTLYSDDGVSYAYERGESQITKLHWDDSNKKLTHAGASAWNVSDEEIVKVAGR